MVENAFVETLPTKVWSCEYPGSRGYTIGSSGARCAKAHELTKYAALGARLAPNAEVPPRATAETRTARPSARTPAKYDERAVAWLGPLDCGCSTRRALNGSLATGSKNA